MHNIRPAGQKWPAEAFNLVRSAKKRVLLACVLDKSTLEMGKNISLWPLGMAELCTPDVEGQMIKILRPLLGTVSKRI